MRDTMYSIVMLLCVNIIIAQEHQAYVEYDKVLESIAVYGDTKEDISFFKKRLNDSIEAMVNEYQLINHKNDHHQSQLTPLQICTLEKKLRKIENRITRFKKNALEKIYNNQQEIKQELKTTIDVGVKKYCNEYHISIMVDKSAVLFCDDCVNHTDRLIKYLRKNNSGAVVKRI